MTITRSATRTAAAAALPAAPHEIHPESGSDAESVRDEQARSAPRQRIEPTPDLLLHLGYHKTGTTWLQRRIFDSRTPGSPFVQPWTSTITDALVTPHPLHFDPIRARETFEEGLRTARAEQRVPVLSAERLSGNPHSGGYDSEEIALRLAACFPEACVLLVVREQASAILSGYRQYVRVGGACSLRRYLEPPRTGRARVPWFRFEHFEYDRYVARLQEIFGRDRVLVLTHARLRADADAFVDRILAHTGRERSEDFVIPRERVNRSLSDPALALKRPVNFLLVRDGVNPAGLIDDARFSRRLQRMWHRLDRLVPKRVRGGMNRRLQRHLEEGIGDRYRASNRRLAELIDRDLAAEGWPV